MARHHVLVYALTGDQVTTALELDANDEGEGYTCFGGPLPNAPGESQSMLGGGTSNLVSQIAAWVPGSVPQRTEEGSAIPVAAGSKIVMQIHYSAAGGEPEPDQTAVEFIMTDESPEYVVRTVPLAIPQLDIPAGVSDTTVNATYRNWSDSDVTIGSLAGHMHLLGTEISATALHEGDAEECGLDIPRWDFDWQLTYRIQPTEPLRIAPGDGIRIQCSYDNSAENQPFVDGVQQEPRDVGWGDGSLDEMCLMYAQVIEPYVPETVEAGSYPCSSVSECYAASDGSLSALFACESIGTSCFTCPLEAGMGCGLTTCAFSLAAEAACLTDCVLSTNAFGGSIDRCIRETCPEAYDSFLACADPIVQGGACDAALTDSCGL